MYCWFLKYGRLFFFLGKTYDVAFRGIFRGGQDLRSGQFRGQKGWSPLKNPSKKTPHYMFLPRQNINSHSLKIRDTLVFYVPIYIIYMYIHKYIYRYTKARGDYISKLPLSKLKYANYMYMKCSHCYGPPGIRYVWKIHINPLFPSASPDLLTFSVTSSQHYVGQRDIRVKTRTTSLPVNHPPWPVKLCIIWLAHWTGDIGLLDQGLLHNVDWKKRDQLMCVHTSVVQCRYIYEKRALFPYRY